MLIRAGWIATLTGVVALATASSAPAAERLYIRGAGWGHGVGMSQWGAYGFAKRGDEYRTILSHYYTGTRLGSVPTTRVVRVLVRSAGSVSFTGATRAGRRRLNRDATYSVARYGSAKVELRSASGRRIGRYTAPLKVRGRLRIARGARYRGGFEFRPGRFSGVNAINAVRIEDYVRGVVARESPSSWPLEALKAQAVAARTYALTTNAGGQGFDQYPDTRSQVYGGIGAETPETDAAVAGTRGEVVTYDGEPVVTFFFSTSGGETENVENAFGGSTPMPWLKGVDDPYDRASPEHRWGPIKLTMSTATRRLRGLVKGTFQGIKVTDRGVSPRIVKALVQGSDGETEVTGATLRSRFGLKDTWAYFTVVSSDEKPPEELPKEPEPEPQPAPGDPSGGAPGPPRASARHHYSAIGGRILPSRPGARVAIQQRRPGGGWRTVAATRVDEHGRYIAGVAAPGRYRVTMGRIVGPSLRIGRASL